ncbi:MAG: PIG-L family deacetylase [Patescibacteria group bacterium]
MKNDLIKTIIASKKPCYFISPHFDDAVLSAGFTMHSLIDHNHVTVINVFTKADVAPYTLSAKKNLLTCHYHDAVELFEEREKEDKRALHTVANRVLNLGFVDGLWRKKHSVNPFMRMLAKKLPELTAVYPTYRFHMLKKRISSEDAEMIEMIKKKLLNLIPKDAIVFAPLSVGNHIDHFIVCKVVEELFPSAIFWSDFPYNISAHAVPVSAERDVYEINPDQAVKRTLIGEYKTQLNGLFVNGKVPEHTEKFYSKRI